MVGHEAIGSVAQPIITFVDMLKNVKEVLAILIVLEDRFLLVAARRNVIYGTRVFYAKRTRHGTCVA